MPVYRYLRSRTLSDDEAALDGGITRTSVWLMLIAVKDGPIPDR